MAYIKFFSRRLRNPGRCINLFGVSFFTCLWQSFQIKGARDVCGYKPGSLGLNGSRWRLATGGRSRARVEPTRPLRKQTYPTAARISSIYLTQVTRTIYINTRGLHCRTRFSFSLNSKLSKWSFTRYYRRCKSFLMCRLE